MSQKKQASQAFTVIELMIVAVIVGIMAVLVMFTYSGIQQKNRDSERKSDINSISVKLEAYNALNGRYPTLANLNDNDTSNSKSFVSINMSGLSRDAFKDPKGTAFSLCKSTQASCYAYIPSPSTCDNGTNGDCISYSLVASLESGGTYTKQSTN